ncbi:hypothetical protein QR98_0081070 [Sarcoptes scabiei]|uniref:Uncharacterized protein n=1 Tax=Sarcoptes scabiei TaxID=52283 RepID=A0A132AF03_SARSC|nr:hypothetical protein QR98_0081070 [Sarcoptes scabiei]
MTQCLYPISVAMLYESGFDRISIVLIWINIRSDHRYFRCKNIELTKQMRRGVEADEEGGENKKLI